MRSKEVFVLALRIIGIWELTRALDYFIEAFDISTKLYLPSVITIGSSYAHLLAHLGVGLYFLSGAPHLVHRIYGPPREEDKDDSTPKT